MELLRKIQHILPEVPSIQGIYTYRDHHELKHLSELIDLGKVNTSVELLEQRKYPAPAHIGRYVEYRLEKTGIS